MKRKDQTQKPAWLTDNDVANRYAVARVTVWRWAHAGNIPRPRKIGPNSSRWSAAELDAHDARMLVNQRTQAIG